MYNPKVELNEDEKLWIKEYIRYYLRNETPDIIKIRLKIGNNSLKDFDPNKIDKRLFTSTNSSQREQPNIEKELNLFGVYCFKKDHELVMISDGILRYIAGELLHERDTPITFSENELHEKLGFPLNRIRTSLRLIYHCWGYANGGAGLPRTFGYTYLNITEDETIDNYGNYETIGSFINVLLEEQYFQEYTMPISKAALALKTGVLPANLSKKDSKWKELFEKYAVGEVSRIPLIELLPLVQKYYTRKNWLNKMPQNIDEMKRMLS